MKSASETLDMITEAYGDSAMGDSTGGRCGGRWRKTFTGGSISVADDLGAGRSKDATDQRMIESWVYRQNKCVKHAAEYFLKE